VYIKGNTKSPEAINEGMQSCTRQDKSW